MTQQPVEYGGRVRRPAERYTDDGHADPTAMQQLADSPGAAFRPEFLHQLREVNVTRCARWHNAVSDREGFPEKLVDAFAGANRTEQDA